MWTPLQLLQWCFLDDEDEYTGEERGGLAIMEIEDTMPYTSGLMHGSCGLDISLYTSQEVLNVRAKAKVIPTPRGRHTRRNYSNQLGFRCLHFSFPGPPYRVELLHG